jgi:Domain of unknown function (DUF4384)
MSISSIQISSMRVSLALGFFFTAVGSGTLMGQQSSARNMFWSASDLVRVSANPGAETVLKSAPPAATDKKPDKTTAPARTAHSKPHVDPALVEKNGYGTQPQFVAVSDDQIGIRYSLLLRDSAGNYTEVSPKTTFHNGDHLRLSVMANQPGFLYVIQQGSTGSWKPIFPAAKAAGVSDANVNQIEQGHVYQIPNGKGTFQFDANPGEEKLFLVLSRQRISDLDSTILSLRDPAHPAPADAQPQPQNSAAQSQVLEATNRIPDELVQKLASRDLSLVQEEVDDPVAGDKGGEKAVYVVSKVSYVKNNIPRVVASVTLHHQ